MGLMDIGIVLVSLLTIGALIWFLACVSPRR